MPDPFPFTVLQVVPELDTGGVEQTVMDVARAVIAAGGRAVVVSKGGRLVPQLLEMGAIFHPLPVQSKNPYVQWRNYFALKALIRAEGVDIVHVRSRAPAMAAIAAARAMGAKSVTTYHGIYKATGRLKRWYNAQMTRADITIANSDYTRAHILAGYEVDPSKVISIPRGVDLTRFDPMAVSAYRKASLLAQWGIEAHDTRPRFILAGRLTRWKGQALILEALNVLKTQGEDSLQVIFAGEDQGRTEYTQELKSLITRFNLADQVKMVGHCSDMPAAYALCDFALAPSLEPEAFGRTAVEPQAMGKPVLAARHGATVETVEDGVSGWLVAPRNVDAWAQNLKMALQTPISVREAMGRVGQSHVIERFSLEVMCARTLDVYRQLLR